MRRLIPILSLLLLTLPTHGLGTCVYSASEGEGMPVRIYELENGLKVYLSRNDAKPEIQTMVVIRAGSRNDPEEDTGMAHYLEHLMFKGTRRFGTLDYPKEEVCLMQIDSLYGMYRQATDPATRKRIYHEIDSVSGASSHYAIANEYGKLMDDLGAREVNAHTSLDKTCYHEVIPTGELERWATIASERFSDMVVRAFHTELETVYEEYNITATTDNRRVNEATNALLYPELKCRQHAVIGLPEHLKNPSPENVRQFYQTYYRPNNAAIILSGDLDYDEATDIVNRHFGKWQEGPMSETHMQERSYGATVPGDTIIGALETPAVLIAWRFPPMGSPESFAAEMLAQIMQNGKCGLLDRDLLHPKVVNAVWAYTEPNIDYTTFYLYALPREGQTTDDVQGLLLSEVDSLRQGRFTEEMLRAIAANRDRARMQDMRKNSYRADYIANAWLSGLPYEEYCAHEQGKVLLTRDSLIGVARRYLNESCAVVRKDTTLAVPVTEMEKPRITPICMNRDCISAFRDSLLHRPGKAVSPVFTDYSVDIAQDTLKGREILYRTNTEDSLFTLTFVAPRGTIADPYLELATNILSLAGTRDMEATTLQERLYSMACDMRISVSDGETRFTLSGLSAHMPEALALLEAHLNARSIGKKAYEALVANEMQSRSDARRDRDRCSNQLQCIGYYGEEAMRRVTLTTMQMEHARPRALLHRLRKVARGCSQVIYYGPVTQEHLGNMLTRSLFFSGHPLKDNHDHLAVLGTDSSEVLVLPFDAPNVLLTAYADWGDEYKQEDEAVIALFNEYFSGSMGAVVWQEMREARSLAYSASASYCMPDYAGDRCFLTRYILTQPDKVNDCLAAFDTICDHMPVSEAAFQRAKSALLSRMAGDRSVRSAPLYSYIADRRKGWNTNLREQIYHAIECLTLDDLVRFQQTHVARRTYRYMIVGDLSRIDPSALSSLGSVRILSPDDIFCP